MTGRERVEVALNHQETDRIPVDFGGRVSGISAKLYGAIQEKLGLSGEMEILDTRLMLAKVDEEMMKRFNVDTRFICQKSAKSWDPKWNPEKTRYTDEWGSRLGTPAGGYYFDYVDYPLKDAKTEADILAHPWPDFDATRNDGILEQVKQWSETVDPFILTSFKGPFEQSWALRGMEQLMLDLSTNPGLAECLLRKVLDTQKKFYGPFLELVAPYIGMICFTDDLGGQLELMISPRMYRKIVYPLHCEMVRFIREKAPKAKVAFHCCGSIVRLLDDIVEMGIDVLNPVQVTAKNMDIHWLKDNYGDKLSFWGGIDTQHMLVSETPQTVRKTAEETKRVLGKNGGYLYAPCHCIQANTPVDNVLAMFGI